MVVGLCGKVWSDTHPLVGVEGAIRLDFEESQIRIPMDILNIYYDGYPNTKANPAVDAGNYLGKDKNGNAFSSVDDHYQQLFQKAVRWSVADKGKIDVERVSLEDITSSDTRPPFNLKRTEFDVVIKVPSEISAQALEKRLNEGGTLMKTIRENLEKHKCFDDTKDNVVVQYQAMQHNQGKLGVSESDVSPTIVTEMDVRGLNYKDLALDKVVKEAFANAVQSGIIAQGNGLQAKSVALDVSDGGTNAGLPFVHVVAKFPAPPGMSTDATMSKWPGGATGIGSAVQTNVRGIPNVDRVSQDASGVQHTIDVLVGTLHLGAVRQAWETLIRTEFEFRGVDHNTQSPHVAPSVVKAKLLEIVKAKVGKDNEVVAAYIPVNTEAAAKLATNLKIQVTVSAKAPSAAARSVSDWQLKLLPAGADVHQFLKSKHKASIPTPANFKVMVGVPDMSQQIDSVDFDVVVHGLDYENIDPSRKPGFLSDLAEAVQDALTSFNGHDPSVLTVAMKEDIEVTLSSSAEYSNAINVRVHIPAPATPALQYTLLTNVESNLDVAIQAKLEEKVKAMPGVKYISSWTNNAIQVSVPSHIKNPQV